jgi:hypothetical protein
MNLELFFLICGVISFAATELAKPFTRLVLTNKDARVLSVRLIACFVGAVAGYSLNESWIGFWVGFAAGALNAGIVGYLKLKLNITDSSTNKSSKEKDE